MLVHPLSGSRPDFMPGHRSRLIAEVKSTGTVPGVHNSHYYHLYNTGHRGSPGCAIRAGRCVEP